VIKEFVHQEIKVHVLHATKVTVLMVIMVDITAITMTAGSHTLKIVAEQKNTSSTGWYVAFSHLALIKTGT